MQSFLIILLIIYVSIIAFILGALIINFIYFSLEKNPDCRTWDEIFMDEISQARVNDKFMWN
jgi:hypothetical protein